MTDAALSAFEQFVPQAEGRLRRALVSIYGPSIGRDAATDALSWAWENWDRLAPMANPVGYLFRVGQTAARRELARRPTPGWGPELAAEMPEVTPELIPALGRLSEQQRAAVVLVSAYGVPQRQAAEVLNISISTLREHLARGMQRLRAELEER